MTLHSKGIYLNMEYVLDHKQLFSNIRRFRMKTLQWILIQEHELYKAGVINNLVTRTYSSYHCYSCGHNYNRALQQYINFDWRNSAGLLSASLSPHLFSSYTSKSSHIASSSCFLKAILSSQLQVLSHSFSKCAMPHLLLFTVGQKVCSDWGHRNWTVLPANEANLKSRKSLFPTNPHLSTLTVIIQARIKINKQEVYHCKEEFNEGQFQAKVSRISTPASRAPPVPLQYKLLRHSPFLSFKVFWPSSAQLS